MFLYDYVRRTYVEGQKQTENPKWYATSTCLLSATGGTKMQA